MNKPIRHMMTALGAAGAIVLAWPTPASAQVSGGALIAANCAVCHGPGGGGAGDIAKLNDKTAAQIVEAMKGFRDGKKPSTIMGRIAKGYSDAQVSAVASHLGKK